MLSFRLGAAWTQGLSLVVYSVKNGLYNKGLFIIGLMLSLIESQLHVMLNHLWQTGQIIYRTFSFNFITAKYNVRYYKKVKICLVKCTHYHKSSQPTSIELCLILLMDANEHCTPKPPHTQTMSRMLKYTICIAPFTAKYLK